MTIEQSARMENIKDINSKIEVLEIILSTMEEKNLKTRAAKNIVEELKNSAQLVEEEMEELIYEAECSAETEKEFFENNVVYLMNRISLHEDEVYSILNKPECPAVHKLNHSSLMEFLKPIVCRQTGEEVNDVSVVQYIEKLIAQDLNKQTQSN